MQTLKIIVLSVIFGLASGMVGAFVFEQYQSVDPVTTATSSYVEESQLIDAVAKVEESVVAVKSSRELEGFPGKFLEASSGTGFVVGTDGTVLTNRHVVDAGTKFEISFKDGRSFEGELVDVDDFNDIAVLKIVGDDLEFKPVEFGDSDLLKVGQKVVSIGNALSQYTYTATAGIVSAKARDVTASTDTRGNFENLSGLIQTDAAINFGSSGGPLINLKGEVIGMNTAVANSANDIGFAIPSNDLKPVLKSVEKNGKIVRPVMGVRFLMLTEAQAKELDIDIDHGALLIGNVLNGDTAIVEGGAAEEAGLEAMDVILSVDGTELSLEKPLHKVLQNYEPGDTVGMSVWRKGEVFDVDITLKSSEEF